MITYGGWTLSKIMGFADQFKAIDDWTVLLPYQDVDKNHNNKKYSDFLAVDNRGENIVKQWGVEITDAFFQKKDKYSTICTD